MYRIILTCSGIPMELGAVGAQDVSEEFTHRPWHQNVTCEWDGEQLILYAENDYDADGQALLDECSDAISACIEGTFGYGLRLKDLASV